jgi:hypothetical protein
LTIDRTTEPQGTLWLDAPDWSQLDDVVQRGEPWALWRVGFQSVLAHWMDEAVRRNVARVEIVSPDRPERLVESVKGGIYWSRDVTIQAIAPANAPAQRESLACLPHQPATALPTTSGELLRHWFQVQMTWLQSRDEKVSLDRQLHPRVWVGPGVVIHPQARLTGPCWIGSRSQIGADSVIGPNAIIGTHAVIDRNASVTDAVVMPDTFIGSNLHLKQMIGDGEFLLDAHRDSRVQIVDRFMMARLRPSFWSWLTGGRKRS